MAVFLLVTIAVTLVSLQRLSSLVRQNYYQLLEIRTTGWHRLPAA
jgi:hypothetical protein